jgi:hypothetical protein
VAVNNYCVCDGDVHMFTNSLSSTSPKLGTQEIFALY